MLVKSKLLQGFFPINQLVKRHDGAWYYRTTAKLRCF